MLFRSPLLIKKKKTKKQAWDNCLGAPGGWVHGFPLVSKAKLKFLGASSLDWSLCV